MIYKSFKGTTSEYRMLHYWVEKQLGKPKQCENCDTTEVLRYEWANISGEYLKDISDWARLCTTCHRLMDGTGNWAGVRSDYCTKGHLRSPENTYIRRRVVDNRVILANICLECQRHHRRMWYKRHKPEAAKIIAEGASHE